MRGLTFLLLLVCGGIGQAKGMLAATLTRPPHVRMVCLPFRLCSCFRSDAMHAGIASLLRSLPPAHMPATVSSTTPGAVVVVVVVARSVRGGGTAFLVCAHACHCPCMDAPRPAAPLGCWRALLVPCERRWFISRTVCAKSVSRRSAEWLVARLATASPRFESRLRQFRVRSHLLVGDACARPRPLTRYPLQVRVPGASTVTYPLHIRYGRNCRCRSRSLHVRVPPWECLPGRLGLRARSDGLGRAPRPFFLFSVAVRSLAQCRLLACRCLPGSLGPGIVVHCLGPPVPRYSRVALVPSRIARSLCV